MGAQELEGLPIASHDGMERSTSALFWELRAAYVNVRAVGSLLWHHEAFLFPTTVPLHVILGELSGGERKIAVTGASQSKGRKGEAGGNIPSHPSPPLQGNSVLLQG